MNLETKTPPDLAAAVQRRQLVKRLNNRIAPGIARARLAGRTELSAADLIQQLRLTRKRPSIAKLILELSVQSLRDQGLIGGDMEVR